MRTEIIISHAPGGADDATALATRVQEYPEDLSVDREVHRRKFANNSGSFVLKAPATIFVALITPDCLTDDMCQLVMSAAAETAEQGDRFIVVLLSSTPVPASYQDYATVSFTRPIGLRVVADILSAAKVNRPVRRPSPFVGKADELQSLVDWCTSPETHAGAMMVGAPGTGRTRLATELCARMRADGWNAGFGDDSGLLPSSTLRILVVIDHAEIAPAARILKALHASTHDRTRVLLLRDEETLDIILSPA